MAWWNDYFEDVDSFDLTRLAPWFDEAVELRFANWPERHGRDATVAAFADFWANIKGLSHTIHGAVAHDGRVCVEADVTFVRLDERQVTTRAATVFDKPGDRITAIHVYVDVTPVFAP